MTTSPLGVVTLLGDSLVLLPASVLLSAFLARFVSRGSALSWMKALVGCLAVLAAAKFAGYLVAAATGSPAISLSSHAALATLFYMALWLVAVSGATVRGRAPSFLVAAGVVGAIALSRLDLTAHTPLEIGLGLLLGSGFAVRFARRRHDRPPPDGNATIAAYFCVLIVLSAGRIVACAEEVNLETLVQVTAATLRDSLAGAL